jgi:hypothetical protein
MRLEVVAAVKAIEKKQREVVAIIVIVIFRERLWF